MRARYSKYFLNHVLLLEDGFATYYVQECYSIEEQIPGIALKSFLDHREAVSWLKDCVGYNHCGMRNIRGFLSDSAPRSYLLYQMNDRQVMDEAARVIMEYDYPVVIQPVFEPPDRQSELIDLIFEVRNKAELFAATPPKSRPYYQVGKLREFTLDGNVPLNVLKIIPNGITELMNSGIDAFNAVIYDAQYINDNGLAEYTKRLKKAGANDRKNIAKGASDVVQYGPRQAINAITSIDLKTIKAFFGSALYAENWEVAVQVALGLFLFKKPGNSILKGTGGSAATKPKAAKAKKANRSALDNDSKKNIKSKDTVGPKKATNREKLSDLSNAEFDQVKNVSTFKPLRVSKNDAKKYLLETEEGKELLRLTKESAGPGASIDEVIDRAIGYVQTGDDLPKLKHVDFPLVKIVPKGQGVSDYSPFFTSMDDLKAAQTANRPLSDMFGLPATSDSPVYDVFQIKPKSGSGTVFASKIAPTQELGGKLTTQGGAKQFIVPNRSQFTTPQRLYSIGDNVR